MLDWLFSLAPYIIVGSLCLLVGAGIGYFSGYGDAERRHLHRRG
jgi:hypothetical protein